MPLFAEWPSALCEVHLQQQFHGFMRGGVGGADEPQVARLVHILEKCC